MVEIGEKIKSLRKKNKLTQEELAKRLNSHQVMICYWERGKRIPSGRSIIKLSKFFGENILTINLEKKYNEYSR